MSIKLSNINEFIRGNAKHFQDFKSLEQKGYKITQIRFYLEFVNVVDYNFIIENKDLRLEGIKYLMLEHTITLGTVTLQDTQLRDLDKKYNFKLYEVLAMSIIPMDCLLNLLELHDVGGLEELNNLDYAHKFFFDYLFQGSVIQLVNVDSKNILSINLYIGSQLDNEDFNKFVHLKFSSLFTELRICSVYNYLKNASKFGCDSFKFLKSLSMLRKDNAMFEFFMDYSMYFNKYFLEDQLKNYEKPLIEGTSLKRIFFLF